MMHSKELNPAALANFQEWMNRYTNYVIVTHVSPDGDAIGSSLALFHYLIEKGKNARIIVPNSFPDFFRWMPMVHSIVQYDIHKKQADLLIEQAEVVCCLDFNTLKRIDTLGEALTRVRARTLLLDHHPFPDPDFDITFSHPEMCATAELVFRFITALGSLDDISWNCATCIYTGMVTDTGGFAYNSSRSEIFVIVSQLLDKGINKDFIHRRIFNSNSEGRMRLMGHTLCSKMKLYPELQTALIWLTQEELKQFGYTKGDTEGFVNLPLQIRGIVFACFLREDKTMIKVSLRSVGTFSCTEFASRIYNGGGHRNASGGEFYGTMGEAIAQFEEGLEEFRPWLVAKK